jgi:hypothetical protein
MAASRKGMPSGNISSVLQAIISNGISAHSSNCFLLGDVDANTIFSFIKYHYLFTQKFKVRKTAQRILFMIHDFVLLIQR